MEAKVKKTKILLVVVPMLLLIAMFALAVAGSADAATAASDDASASDAASASDTRAASEEAAPGDGSDGGSGFVSLAGRARNRRRASDVEHMKWAEDMDCATCHESEADSAQDKDCAMSEHAGLECLDCHTDVATLKDAHERYVTVDGETTRTSKVALSPVKSEACTACHDVSDLVEATSGLTVLTDSEGTTVNPHDLPDVQDHESIACGNCHVMHTDGGPAEVAVSTCLNCHHKDVYECYTCHK